MTETTKTKIAVLGGGAGAMAAAFELLRTPERRAALDVTVYQMGWRLGGKGASGRNHELGERIEEHGLHLWFGFYDNAFRVLGDAYDVADRPAGRPLATLWEAFEPCHEIVIYDRYDGQWSSETFDVPTDPARPGEDGTTILPGEVIHRTVQFMHGRWRVVAGLRGLAVEVVEKALEEALSHAERRRRDGSWLDHEADVLIADSLKAARALIWHHVKHHLDHAPSRHFFQLADVVASAWSGMVAEQVLAQGFSVIDDRDFIQWLREHGASDITVSRGDEGSGILRGFYDLVFAYAEGDTDRPDLAAGRALQAALKIVFDFKGSIMWRMQAGMGDTVFGPFYEALTELGGPDCVQFFHRVTRLRLDPTRTSVAAIDVVEQARPRSGSYQPMRDVKGLACWPSQPDWAQLVDGDQLLDAGVDLERPAALPSDVARTLEVGRDFDLVVLAIPVPAHPDICAELIDANDAYREMVASHRAVATQAFQVWSSAPETDLGWPFPREAVASGFVEPLDTLCPMPQLLDREAWPAGSVQSIWYACGVLPGVGPWRADAEDDHARQVRENAIRWLEDDSPVPWPSASGDGGFDWSLLGDPSTTDAGAERFESQYWRANVTPSELYVRTPPGSVVKRLWPGSSGFANLALAGDWTRNFIDGGCVEAAVLSGLLAARAVLEQAGVPDATVRIDGEGTWLLGDRDQ